MPAVAAPLQAIIEVELAAGNSIRETSSWPPTCELLIILRRKFRQPYSLAPAVMYRLLDDVHYWYAEYSFNAGQQTLACGFD
jgi:hypothetical protein